MNIDEIYEPYVLYTEPGSVESLGWSSVEAQQTRFKIISEIGIENSDSVLDVGCGYGDFSYHVGGNYLGIDIRKHPIELAKEKYKLRKFEHKGVFAVEENFDWVVGSGIFCFNSETWERDTLKTLTKMYELSNKGVAVNFLSAVNEEHEPDTLVCKYPGEVIDKIVSKICHKFTVRHDYELQDFTVYLYK